MADKYPFSEDPTGPKEDADPGVLQNIATYLQDPKLGPAIANVGFQMAAGGQWGDTTMSRLARGFHEGGVGIRQAEAQQLKEREAASKEDLRAAQAQAAEARAGAAGAGLDAKAGALEVKRGHLELAQQALDYKREIDARRVESKDRNDFFNYIDKTTKRNVTGSLLGGAQEPLLPFDQWTAKGRPSGDAGLNVPGGTGGGEGSQKAIPMPDSKDKMIKGQLYETKAGPQVWKGETF